MILNVFKETDVALDFISSQPYLTCLSITGENIPSDIINGCLKLNLKQFGMLCNAFFDNEPLAKNYTIKEFTIGSICEYTELNVHDLLRKLVAVECITFRRCKISDDTSLVLLHELEHFRALKFNRCIFQPMYYPKLRELSIKHCVRTTEIFRMIRFNRQIAKLEVSTPLSNSPEFLAIRNELNAEVSISDDEYFFNVTS
jgi:hypothetical protein